MDSLHLFTIPKWLPDTLLPELWAIVFNWKWRLEMKDIHKELVLQIPNEERYVKICEYSNCIDGAFISGNSWAPEIMYVAEGRTIVTPKCGIEFLSRILYIPSSQSGIYRHTRIPRHWWAEVERNSYADMLRKYMANNHGITCQENSLGS